MLKPEGTLRLTKPYLTPICELFLNVNRDATIDQFGAVWRGGAYTPERWANAQFRAHGHQFIWSMPALSAALRDAGFGCIARVAPRATLSGLPELKQLERHYSEREPAWVFARTLVVEAAKSPPLEMRGRDRF